MAGIGNDNALEALMLATFVYVDDRNVDTESPCGECSDIDAFVWMNLYVRDRGQCVRFVECCVGCGKRICLEERHMEILIEVPQSLRDEINA